MKKSLLKTNTHTIPFNRASLVGNEIEHILDAVRRGQLAGDGEFSHRCSKLLQQQLGVNRVFLTHSCTAALEMAAILCDLCPGDEVIMPSFTFVSTANAVALRGATPVFVDIDPETLNIDPAAVATAITDHTKAIFAVHYAGFPSDMDPLFEIGSKHGVLVVEDAAHALGSTYKGRPVGSLGDLATFSFHETKNVISGEGGALVVNREDLVERAEIIREKGTNRSQFFRGEVDKYTWVDIGSSFLPGELIAAFLLGQLQAQDEIQARRRSVFNAYQEAFQCLEEKTNIALPKVPPYCEGNAHMFYFLMESESKRAEFISYMKSNGIMTPFHFVPLHSAPAGKRFGRTCGDLSVTNRVSERLVRLPMYYDMGDDVEKVIETAFRALKVK